MAVSFFLPWGINFDQYQPACVGVLCVHFMSGSFVFRPLPCSTPCPATPCPTLPCPAMPSRVPRPALPGQAGRCQALPALALPCTTKPCRASPSLVPRHAKPRRARPSLALPHHAADPCSLPCPAPPGLAKPNTKFLAQPCLAGPRPARPSLVPCLAKPCQASTSRAWAPCSSPSLAQPSLTLPRS